MNTLATIIDKEQLDAERPQQFRYLHKEAAVDWNTVGRYALEALPGAGLGILLNRGILRNKSLGSNALAAILGGTASTGLVEAIRSVDAKAAEAQKQDPLKYTVSNFRQRNAASQYVDQLNETFKQEHGRDMTENERALLMHRALEELRKMEAIPGTTLGAGVDLSRMLLRAVGKRFGGPGAFFLNDPETMYAQQFSGNADLKIGSDVWNQRMNAYRTSGLKSGGAPTVSEYVNSLRNNLDEANKTSTLANAQRAIVAGTMQTAESPQQRKLLKQLDDTYRREARAADRIVSNTQNQVNRYSGAQDLLETQAVANRYVRHSPIPFVNNMLRRAAHPIPIKGRNAARLFRGLWIAPTTLAGIGLDAMRILVNRRKADPELKAVYDSSTNTPPAVYND
jgi:hypothetical protein